MCKTSVAFVCIVLLVVAGNALATELLLRCDAGGCGPLQSGWVSLGACGTYTDVGGTGIDVTLATGNPSACECRNTGGTGTLADVESDLLFANDEQSAPNADFILTLSNLMPGAGYQVLSYHNRSDEGVTTIPNVTVTGAMNVTRPSSIVQDHPIMDNPAEITFTAGSGDVTIRYQAPDGGCSGCQAFFNGFELYSTGPTVGFETDASGGIETITPALISVVVTNPEAGATYTVDYAATDGTATGGGVDYTLIPDTLVFSPGETQENISVDIVSDGPGEADETIIITLSNPSGPNAVLGISEHTYTISDSLPSVSFDNAAGSGSENVTPAQIAVSLSHASDVTTTVDYAVIGGDATGGGIDYTLLGTGTLTFAPLEAANYISLDVVDDTEIEADETVILTLYNPTNASLGPVTEHTYAILDNEKGLFWDGLTWFYSGDSADLFINPDGDLEWSPEGGEQFITRIPEHPLSNIGDVVEVSYIWMTDGDHDCPDCFACPDGCYDDDITCIAGTSDMRVGLFEADGEYVQADGFEVTGSSIFTGYKGYEFRFGPNMLAGPTKWVDCHGETHKTGQFCKKPVGNGDLMYVNDGLMAALPGLELPVGEYALFTVRLRRTASNAVEMTISLGDKTYSYTDSSSTDQPSKIDVLAVHMRNHRPYTRLVLDNICTLGPADFDGDDIVDANDLEILAGDWLKTGSYEVRGSEPDANDLVLHYSFNGTWGNNVPTGLVDNTSTYTATIVAGSDPDSTIKYADPNPTYNGGGTSARFNNDNWSNNAGDTFLIPDSGGIDFSSFAEFTVELFLRPSSSFGLGQNRRIFSEYVYAYMYLDPGNGLYAVRKWGGGAWDENRTVLTGPGFQMDDWSHVAMTWDSDAIGDRLKLYVDGELVDSAGGNSALTLDSTAGFAIGGYQREDSSRAQFFNGDIDEFRLYDYALSEDEIIYTANNGPTSVLVPPDSVANLHEDEIINFRDFAAFALQWFDTCE